MQLTLDLDQIGHDYHIFQTKGEYDAHPHSEAGYDRYHKAHPHHKPYGGPCHRFTRNPTTFPCVMIEVHTWDNPNGPYEIECLILDATSLKDQEV